MSFVIFSLGQILGFLTLGLSIWLAQKLPTYLSMGRFNHGIGFISITLINSLFFMFFLISRLWLASLITQSRFHNEPFSKYLDITQGLALDILIYSAILGLSTYAGSQYLDNHLGRATALLFFSFTLMGLAMILLNFIVGNWAVG